MEERIQVVDADYKIEGEKVVVRCFARSENDDNILLIDEDFLPYLYVLPEKEEFEAVKEEIESTKYEEEGEPLPIRRVEEKELIDGKEERKVLKVYSNVPPKIPKLKNKFWDIEEVEECREFDIPFYKRYLIDKDIRPGAWIEIEGREIESEEYDQKIRVERIETDLTINKNINWDKAAFDLEVYQEEIIMASIFSNEIQKVLTTEEIDKEYVETVENEEDIISRLVDFISDRDIDILLGYNTDEYDFDILRERSNEHGITLSLGRDGERMKFNRRGRFSGARLKGRMHLDLYPFVSHVLSPGLDSETLDLDSVASEMLDMSKNEFSWEQMKKSWAEKDNLEEFAEYALKDSELAYKLGLEIAPQILELSKITGLIPFDACRLTYGQLTENYLLREASKREIISPNRPSQDKRNKRRREGAYSGGFVYTPDAGLYENIAVFDFKSLYPTVMVAHNISPDTLNLDECDKRYDVEEFDYDFCQDNQGFFPELIQELVEDRSEIKSEMKELDKGSLEYKNLDNRQKARKILGNSFYGYLGYNGARWYSKECAEATTYLGREYINDTIDLAEDMGFEMIYGDTDSVVLKKKNLKEEKDEFLEQVNSNLPDFMQLEYEGFFKRGFFTSTDSGEGAKKKYALLKENRDMKITGFEQVRRDWSPIAKSTQKKVIRKVLENDIEGAVSEAKNTIKRLKEGEVPVDQLKIYTTLNKKPENYDSTAPHVEAAKKAIKKGKEIQPGSTIAYVITRGGGSISQRARILEHADSYDAEYYIENQVLPVVIRVLKVFGYSEGQLKGEGKQSGLSRFG